MSERKSIFELETKVDIQKECTTIYSALTDPTEKVIYGYAKCKSYFDFIDNYVFYRWPYRGTCLSIHDFINLIGLRRNGTNLVLDETCFLCFLELIYNIDKYASVVAKEDGLSDECKYSPKIFAAINNIKTILSRMNCQIQKQKDKYIITKMNPEVDTIIRYTPDSLADSILAYGDFRIEKDLKAKQAILKDIDLYIEKDKVKLRSYNKGLYERIQQIVNKLGINHNIESPYDSLSKDDLIVKYDECFTMMVHLLRFDAIKQIENKNKNFFLEMENLKDKH